MTLANPLPQLFQRPTIRFAELVALLSLGTDLGLGQPMEHMIRACLIALRLAERLDLEESERAVLYYSGLLAWVGCHTDAYEQAKWLGDDTTLKADAHYYYDFSRVTSATSGLSPPVVGRVLSRAETGRLDQLGRALELVGDMTRFVGIAPEGNGLPAFFPPPAQEARIQGDPAVGISRLGVDLEGGPPVGGAPQHRAVEVFESAFVEGQLVVRPVPLRIVEVGEDLEALRTLEQGEGLLQIEPLN